jgi:3-methyladenine DNA glycosylase/8-oxoguanine DNA glycosylase
MKMEVDIMSDEKVTQTETTQEQQQEQTQQQDQQQTVDMKTYLELVAKMEKMEQMLANEAEKAQKMAEKEQELFQKQVQLTLIENGLEKFADIVKVSNEDELKDVVKKLSQIVNEIKIETGYVPADHKQMTAYEQAKKQGNTKNMIKALFGMNN